jgi:hypothetical protein
MKFLAALLLLVFSIISSNAQKFDLGAVAGPNLSITTVKSDKQFINAIHYMPGIGYSFGLLLRINISSRLNANLVLTYERRRDIDKSAHELTSSYAELVGIVDKSIIVNQYLKHELSFSYSLGRNFAIGTGLNFYNLLDSKTKFNGAFTGKFSNGFYRAFNMSVPIFISYSIKHVSVRLVFDKGIMSRVSDHSSNVKEIENMLTLQNIYFFSRRK